MQKILPPPEITSARLILRSHHEDLAPLMFELINQDRERLKIILPFVDMTKSIEDSRDYIAKTHRQWNDLELFDYGIFRQSDQRYMGNIGVHNICWESAQCELGYWIMGDFEGHGYVSEAVLSLEDIFFAMGFERIEIRCSSSNQRSMKVPDRCGYRPSGTIHEDRIEKGVRTSALIFAKIKGAGL